MGVSAAILPPQQIYPLPLLRPRHFLPSPFPTLLPLPQPTLYKLDLLDVHLPDRLGFALPPQVSRTVLVPMVYSPGDELERLVESVESVTVMGSERRVRCCVEPGYRARCILSVRARAKRDGAKVWLTVFAPVDESQTRVRQVVTAVLVDGCHVRARRYPCARDIVKIRKRASMSGEEEFNALLTLPLGNARRQILLV